MPFPKEEPRVPVALIAETMRSWEIETMFTCMLRFRSVREEALIVLEKSYFNRLGEGYLAYLLELIRRLHPDHTVYPRIPYAEVINKALDDVIPRKAGMPGILAKDEVKKLLAMPTARDPDRPDQSTWGLIYRSYHQTTNRDVSREQGYKLIAQFVSERGYYEPLRTALTLTGAGNVTNIRSIIDAHQVLLDRVEAISEDPVLQPHPARWLLPVGPAFLDRDPMARFAHGRRSSISRSLWNLGANGWRQEHPDDADGAGDERPAAVRA
jgi:hypothetical protein